MPTFEEVIKWNEAKAREYLEHLRWPDGPVCGHCGSTNVVKLNGKATRPGVHKCRDCREQFTVTIGTIFESSHIGLDKWVQAFHLICASKKGVSALQLKRMLGVAYKTAWFLAHRIRYAMQNEPLRTLLGGEGVIVESDETWVGPRRRKPNGKNLWQDNKVPVIALVERDGNMRTRVVGKVTQRNLRSALENIVDYRSELHTDGYPAYKPLGKQFRRHESVDHNRGEYSRDGYIHCNSAESYFALLKRGIHGTFHHVGKQHLHRYCDEFSFRWNHRKTTDAERTESALRLAPGCRLTYTASVGS